MGVEGARGVGRERESERFASSDIYLKCIYEFRQRQKGLILIFIFEDSLLRSIRDMRSHYAVYRGTTVRLSRFFFFFWLVASFSPTSMFFLIGNVSKEIESGR